MNAPKGQRIGARLIDALGVGKSLVRNRVGRNDYQGQQTHGHQTYELADGPWGCPARC
jgi:hypothetical protein